MMLLRKMWLTHPNTNRARRSLFCNRRVCVAFLLTLLTLGSSGYGETVYSALRVIGTKRGEKVLERVLEVRGVGKREPTTWTIVVADPQTKAGSREIEVRKGRVTKDSPSEKAFHATTPMDLTRLNLDSDGALAVIDQQVPPAIGIQKVSYALANGRESGAPVWVVEFLSADNAVASSMEISADTGEIIARSGPPPADDRKFLTDSETAGADPNTAASAKGDSELPKPEESGRGKQRENTVDVPDAAKTLVKRAARTPIRVLRHFLP